jgi:uncharacterized protein YegL
MKTMICLILDRSGSMGGRENDVVNGVNAFLEDQKKLPDPASIAFVRFDSEGIERFREMQSLAETKPLTRDDYKPRGGTPLLDAVGSTITKLDEDWKAEKPDRAIVVIVTDGEENASREYDKAKVRALIKARQDSGMWAFIYLGANVDAFHEAGKLGVNLANAAGYKSTSAGTASAYSTVSHSVKHMRATGQTVARNLGGDIEEDGSLTPPPAAPAQQQNAAWVAPSSTPGDSTPGAWAPPN